MLADPCVTKPGWCFCPSLLWLSGYLKTKGKSLQPEIEKCSCLSCIQSCSAWIGRGSVTLSLMVRFVKWDWTLPSRASNTSTLKPLLAKKQAFSAPTWRGNARSGDLTEKNSTLTVGNSTTVLYVCFSMYCLWKAKVTFSLHEKLLTSHYTSNRFREHMHWWEHSHLKISRDIWNSVVVSQTLIINQFFPYQTTTYYGHHSPAGSVSWFLHCVDSLSLDWFSVSLLNTGALLRTAEA